MHFDLSYFLRMLALVLFFVGFFIYPAPVQNAPWRGWNFVSAGLFCWCLSTMLG
jgi:hypothetical protein